MHLMNKIDKDNILQNPEWSFTAVSVIYISVSFFLPWVSLNFKKYRQIQRYGLEVVSTLILKYPTRREPIPTGKKYTQHRNLI